MIEYMLPARPGWEPLRISISASWCSSRTGALIGFTVLPDKGLVGIAVLEDGVVQVLETTDFTVDWRYVTEDDRWVDANARETDQEV